MFCDLLPDKEMDISLSTMVQMVLFNDEEVLSSRTLWSSLVLEYASSSCSAGLDLEKVIMTLREESIMRGLYGNIDIK